MPTKITDHKQLEKVYNYPFIEAFVRRRSRRLGLGSKIDHGPLTYKSSKEPIPLNSLETALVCYAGGGSTGVALGDGDLTHGINAMMQWSSRTFASPCNNHQTKLLFTNDAGIYVYKPREAQKIAEVTTLDDLKERVQDFDKEVIKVKDGRLEIPDGPPALLMLNKGMVNRPGQTVFMPIVHPSYELIDMAMTAFQYEHWNIVDDNGKPAGTEKWVDKLKLGLKIPISVLEKNLLVGCSLEAGFMCQNIMLMAQALGLGAFPLSGFTPIIAMGGTPVTKGCGFRFTTDKKRMPNPVGIDGVLEGYCPPYKNMNEAVDTIIEQKFGSCGIFTTASKQIPYLNKTSVTEVDKIPDDVIQCTKDFCNYVYESYGRFPGTVDSMSMPIWVVVHHIDIDFYGKFYPSEAVTETQRNHMADWHSS
jgi:hypothetical protein